MSGSSRRSYSVELHRLISSGELNRLLESCRSNPSGAAKSPSSRQARGAQPRTACNLHPHSRPRRRPNRRARRNAQANFAQYQLPLEEIQRWIAEQGQTDPAASDSASAAPAGQLVQYTEAAAAAPAYSCAEPRTAAPSLPPAELSSTSSTAPHSSGLIDALVDVALSPTSAAVRATKSTAPSPMEHQWAGEYERQRAQAEQMLAALEWRARAWAQQAAAMQAESFRLRDQARRVMCWPGAVRPECDAWTRADVQALVDTDRLASIEQLLMSTVNDLHLRQACILMIAILEIYTRCVAERTTTRAPLAGDAPPRRPGRVREWRGDDDAQRRRRRYEQARAPSEPPVGPALGPDGLVQAARGGPVPEQ